MNLIIKKVDPNSKEKLTEIIDSLEIEFPSKVFIKPNIVASYPSTSGIVTDINLVKVLIKYLKDKGVKKIFIGESCLVGIDIDKVLKTSGYDSLKKYPGVKVLNLDREKRIKLKFMGGQIEIPRIAKDCFYINFAKLKTHNQTKVSLGLKNQKGLLLAKDKKRFHKAGLHKAVAHLALAVSPDLTIIDGINALEGEGPVSLGHLKQANVIIAGKNILEVDSLGCLVMGLNPYKVEHLRIAKELEIGQIDLDYLEKKAKGYKQKFILPKSEGFIKLLRLYLYFSDYTCSACLNLLSQIFRFSLFHPWSWPKIFYAVVLRRTNVLTGSFCQIPQKGRNICVGVCAKKIASRHNIQWIGGCGNFNIGDLIKKL